MLILSRKIGQEVVIGESIRVTVLSVRGRQIRLGFSAPDDVGIVRAELGSESFACSGQPYPSGHEQKRVLGLAEQA